MNPNDTPREVYLRALKDGLPWTYDVDYLPREEQLDIQAEFFGEDERPRQDEVTVALTPPTPRGRRA